MATQAVIQAMRNIHQSAGSQNTHMTGMANTSAHICDRCGKSAVLFHVHKSNGKEAEVCHDCFRDGYYTCKWCNERYGMDSMTYDARGYSICPDCLERNYQQCEWCGDYYENFSMKEIDDYAICPTCLENHYQLCEICGEYCDISVMTEDDGEYICPDCMGNIGGLQWMLQA